MDELKNNLIDIAGIRLIVSEEKPHNQRESNDVPVDTCWFDPSYTLAGSTGFLVWEGSWIFIDFLKQSLGEKIRGSRVVELGSGTGISGLCLAAIGAHVLLTDLPSITHSILTTNVSQNSSGEISPENQSAWNGAKSIGIQGGSAATMSIDWTVPLQSQNSDNNPIMTDYVVAVDTIWLTELLEPLVKTICTILEGPRNPECYIAFKDRYGGTEIFAEVSHLVRLFKERGCVVTEIQMTGKEQDPENLKKHVMHVRKMEK